MAKNNEYWRTPRGVLANVSVHARTLNPPPNCHRHHHRRRCRRRRCRRQHRRKGQKKLNFSIKVLAISDNSDFSTIFFLSAHTNFHDPRTNPFGRKVIRYREREREKTTNLVATMFATQPVCNAARAAHALRSDQKSNNGRGNKDPAEACGWLCKNYNRS
jgi:hypothetical protein